MALVLAKENLVKFVVSCILILCFVINSSGIDSVRLVPSQNQKMEISEPLRLLEQSEKIIQMRAGLFSEFHKCDANEKALKNSNARCRDILGNCVMNGHNPCPSFTIGCKHSQSPSTGVWYCVCDYNN